MNYVQNLRQLVCGAGKQVDTFVKNSMRKEEVPYDGRRVELGKFNPTDQTSDSSGQNATDLLHNNNPRFPTNMVNMLNTPFDHVERILFQDLSGKDLMDIDGANYFKTLFTFANLDDSSEYGFKSISMHETDAEYSSVGYGFVNGKLSSGPFFLDSFTYSSVVDYSVTGYNDPRHRTVVEDKRVGVNQDKFLTDYNVGWYDIKENQADEYRGKMTSTLFELGNLEKDVYDAKIGFRESIRKIRREDVVQNTDAKVYIETFCQHLATLFAKLSNIRMSHVVYGFKHPHAQWEGILALDIWYQMLYRSIDKSYPFDFTCVNQNPMSRYKVDTGASGEYITCAGQTVYVDRANQTLPHGFSWAELGEDDKPIQDKHGYVLVWNNGLFSKFSQTAQDMADNRAGCVTPRGVLKKIHAMVYSDDSPLNEIHMPTGGWDGVPSDDYKNPVTV